MERNFSGIFSKDNNGGGSGFARKYGWIVWVDLIAKERNEKWDNVFDWSVIEFLNMVMYYKDKKEFELSEHRKLLKGYGR